MVIKNSSHAPLQDAKSEWAIVIGGLAWIVAVPVFLIGWFVSATMLMSLLTWPLGEGGKDGTNFLGPIIVIFSVLCGGAIAFALAAGVLNLFAMWKLHVSKSDKRRQASRADKHASQLFEIEINNQNPTVLMLRPFSDEESYLMYSGVFDDEDLPLQLKKSRDYTSINDLFDELGSILRGFFGTENLIMVGDRKSLANTQIGTIETSDADWRDVASELFELSDLIVCLPGGSEGVRWELNQIFGKYLSKTLFIIPPTYWAKEQMRTNYKGHQVFNGYEVAEYQYRRDALIKKWETVSALFQARFGVSVPSVSIKGSTFWIDRGDIKQAPLPHIRGEMQHLMHHPAVRDIYRKKTGQ